MNHNQIFEYFVTICVVLTVCFVVSRVAGCAEEISKIPPQHQVEVKK